MAMANRNTLSSPPASPLSRRGFLISAAAVGGSLVIGLRPAEVAAQNEGGTAAEAATVGDATLTPFIRIPPAGAIEVIVPSAEMGQGVYAAIATLIAEELEVPLEQIRAMPAPADPARYAHPLLGDQITGGSVTIRGFWTPMRQAGAAARTMLVAAAARQWGVSADSCKAEAGVVRHPESGRSAPYGTLAAAAAREPLPETVMLKPASAFTLIGKTLPRIDSPEKVNGTARFGLDAHPPGVKFAALAICPTFGGTLKAMDDSAALAVKGVRQVVRLSDAVAVVADHTGSARKGLAALRITWDAGPNGGLTTEELERRADAAMAGEALVAHEAGDVAAAEAAQARGLDTLYRLPILAHSAMEPMNCTVHVRKDSCDVWVGTQVAGRARQAAAAVTGLPVEKVVVHNHLLGGGFGRRLDYDGITLATRVAQQVDGPVQVVWSREEDIRHDSFRYLNLSRLHLTLGPDGLPVSWRHRVVGPAIMARFLPAFFKDGIDLDIVGGAEGPYDIPNKRVEYVRHEAPEGMLTGNWRGVGPTRNAPAIECGIDEAAHLAGQDPVIYRRRLLTGLPRLRAVLDLAAERAGWGTPLEPGRGRGVAVIADFGSFAALVADVQVTPGGTVRIDRMVCAVDCGQVINPVILKQQVESGIVYGLSAVLYGRLTVADGAIVEGNFDDSPVLRINECPRIDVHVVPSTEAPGGVGELGTPPVAPAVMNAIFAATGQRLRNLPIDGSRLRRA
ncbi:xanthine dehydrogenase family protein molybdopterin-binding subunit (plasmid) [Azospirillum brasilense]|uniref:Xanthine dehydrogenase family protein molybdopterin-binding subunit n=1 Tax=Azospirillum brasilense TaxID=192 RepID=A0A4D8RBY6_AZOBR|nr:molybdopterin cofactor-binding domain-containing protein [Azospirillum brasilense]QCO19501.1 xanthine dehydrogenase family protein molybdopterin-binding subunit [Azospirillum brasilense]